MRSRSILCVLALAALATTAIADEVDDLILGLNGEDKNVRFIFLFNRPTSEFGAKILGRDYYRTLMEWIETNYKMDAVFGDGVRSDAQIGDAAFFIKSYKRK